MDPDGSRWIQMDPDGTKAPRERAPPTAKAPPGWPFPVATALPRGGRAVPRAARAARAAAAQGASSGRG